MPGAADVEIDLKPLRDEVRRLREAAGLTQEQLAEQIGVSGHTIHRFETGQTGISVENLIRIIGALGPETAEKLYAVLIREYFELLPQVAKEALSRDEKRLVDAYRSLPESEKDALLGRALRLAPSLTDPGGQPKR